MKLFDNISALIDQYKRDSARAYLTRVGAQHLQNYPQMCCYSFDDISVEINVDGQCDRCALEALMDLVAEKITGRTVLDVGANIGNHSRVFAEICEKVVSFEPHPVTFQLLKINTSNCDNVIAVNSGASDTSAELRAVSPARNRGATSISNRPTLANEEAWTFNVSPLDSHPEVIGADVALIKMDIEGHEEFALMGLSHKITEKCPIIVVEQNAETINSGTSRTLEIMKGYGYKNFYAIDVSIPWRTPQSFPSIVRKIGRVAESLIFGPSDFTAQVSRITSLENRDYPMLVGTFDPLF